MTKQMLDLPQCPPSDTTITVITIDKRSGEELAREQLVFSIPVCKAVKPQEMLPDWITVEDGRVVI